MNEQKQALYHFRVTKVLLMNPYKGKTQTPVSRLRSLSLRRTQVVAIFSYEAAQPEDLEFVEGDVILVLSHGKCYPKATEPEACMYQQNQRADKGKHQLLANLFLDFGKRRQKQMRGFLLSLSLLGTK